MVSHGFSPYHSIRWNSRNWNFCGCPPLKFGCYPQRVWHDCAKSPDRLVLSKAGFQVPPLAGRGWPPAAGDSTSRHCFCCDSGGHSAHQSMYKLQMLNVRMPFCICLIRLWPFLFTSRQGNAVKHQIRSVYQVRISVALNWCLFTTWTKDKMFLKLFIEYNTSGNCIKEAWALITTKS